MGGDSDDDASKALTKLDSPRWNRGTADATVPQPPASRPGAFDKLSHRYALGVELGRGGMGRVLAATDVALDRPVAVKHALSDQPEMLARFEREARITAKLGHPSIVPVFDSGRDDDGHPFYVMRRIEGRPLADKVTATTPLRDRLALVPNVLAAVDATAFAHAQRIIHRDIKPWNILVGAYGETLLIDWGLARELDAPEADTPLEHASSLTRAGHAYGTAGFMAPEQARGEAVDERADVYALGATLFYVLAGSSQVSGAETAWIEQAAKGEAPVPLDRIAEHVPRELTAIVGKAMAMSAADRYPDAGALADDLRRFLTGQLVAAHTYSTGERLARFVRRHRVAVATVVIATLATAGIGSYAIVNIIRERDDATRARATAEAQRERANDRADQLVLDRAAHFAETEPTRAIITLRQLSPSTPFSRQARAIASIAAARGIASGSRDHTGPLRTLVFAADGQRVLTTSQDGTVRIRDLEHGTSREVWRDKDALDRATWVDGDRTIVVGTHTGLVAIDAATGKPRVLVDGVVDPWPWLSSDGAHVLFADPVRDTLEQVALADGARTHLADDVIAAAGFGDVVIVSGQKTVRLVIRGGKEQPLAQVGAIVVAASAERVAASLDHEVVEWSAVDGRVLNRFPVAADETVLQLGYGARGLNIVRSRGERRVLTDDQNRVRAAGTWTGMWFATDGTRDALLGDDGVIRVMVDGSVETLSLGLAGARLVAISTAWAVAGSSDGTLYWWDLRDRLPRRVVLDDAIAPCEVIGGRVLGESTDQIEVVELATGKATLPYQGMMVGCIPPAVGGRLLIKAMDGAHLLDLATGSVRTLEGARAVTIDERDEAFVYVRDLDVREQRAGGDRLLATLPAPVRMIAARNGIVYAQLDDDTLMRRDPSGAVTTVAQKAVIDRMAVDATGTCWFSVDRALFRWTGSGELVRVATLSDPIDQLAAYRDAGVTAATTNGGLWVVAGDGKPVQRLGPAWSTFVRITQRVAVLARTEGTLVVDLESGLTLVRPGAVLGLGVSADGRQVAIGTGGSPGLLRVYTDRVPSEPGPLRAWLVEATNAMAAPGSDALQWPTP